MTEALVDYLDAFGYLTLLAVGFAEYAGVPIASVPVLMTAGALGTSAGLDPVAAAASAALGGLLADVGWFLLVRWRGAALVDAACGLTTNPNACVLGVEDRVSKLGPAYVIPSKFVPGAGNLVGAASGLSGMSTPRFVLSDALGLLLWAGAYTGLGWLLAEEIRAAVELVARYQKWALAVAAGLVAGAAVWRRLRVLRHRQGHADLEGGRGRTEREAEGGDRR